MKVLWITNNIMPYPAKKIGLKPSPFGGWIQALINEVSNQNNLELAIATINDQDKISCFFDGKVKYYLVPGKKDNKYHIETEKYWKKLDSIFNADVVQIFGSEFYFGLSYVNALPNKKVVLNIQGLISKIAEDYLADINISDIRKNITFRDIIKHDNILQAQEKFAERGSNEIELIKKIKYVIGRTDWDKESALKINNKLKYYHNNESLRKTFYKYEWNIDKIERHSIFISQAYYPLKGLHFFLRALSIVANKYPDTKVYICGQEFTSTKGLKNKIKLSGYGKYINKIIKRNNLANHIVYTGIIEENEVLRYLLKSNVFVLPSKLENSSNSLCEAMILGVPVIATATGGTPSLVADNKSGLLCEYNDADDLANKILFLFENDELCLKLSSNSKKEAQKRHDLKTNVKELCKIYEDIIKDKDKYE